MGATSRNIDFTDVKDGGAFNRNRIPAGDYAAIITKVEDAVAKDKEDMFVFHIKIKSRPSAVFPYYCKLQDNQLWKLRNILIAAGKTVPKKKMKVDPNVVVGKTIGVTVADAEDYNDREQSEVDGVFPASELDEETAAAVEDDDADENDGEDDDLGELDTVASDDEDEEDEPEAEEEEDDEEEEADPLADLTRTELKAAIVKLQADFQAKKSQTDDDLRDVLRALQAKPKAAAKPAAKPVAKAKPKPKTEDISDEELDELDIDSL